MNSEPALVELRARLSAGGMTERYETQRQRKDGSLVDAFGTASPTRDAAGNVVGLSVMLRWDGTVPPGLEVWS